MNQETTETVEKRISEEKLHYDSLISLFKWIIGAISIIFAAGSFLIGYNVSEIKGNIEEELKLARGEIAGLAIEAKNEAVKIENMADLKIDEIKNKAYSDISSSVADRIQSELSTPRLQQLIYYQLRNEVSENLESMIEEEFENASNDLVDLNRKISSLNIKFSESYVFNSIDAIKFIDSIHYNTNDFRLRDIAGDMMIKMNLSKKYFFGYDKGKRWVNELRKEYPEYTDIPDNVLLARLKTDVSTEIDIEKLTKQFQAIEDLSKSRIIMFEFGVVA